MKALPIAPIGFPKATTGKARAAGVRQRPADLREDVAALANASTDYLGMVAAAPQDVDLLRGCFQVTATDAESNPTQVVDHFARAQRPMLVLIGPTVGQPAQSVAVIVGAEVKLAVAADSVGRSRPKQAGSERRIGLGNGTLTGQTCKPLSGRTTHGPTITEGRR